MQRLPIFTLGALLWRSIDFALLDMRASAKGSRIATGLSAEQARSRVACRATVVPAPAMVTQPEFMVDSRLLKSTDAVRRHIGTAGDAPEVQVVATGEAGVYAAMSTLRIRVPAKQVFEYFTDPDENFRIFQKHTAAVNYRHLLDEDKAAGLRTFEVSKTGRWRILGFPLSFESTVYATEDWKNFEISYKLKKPGAMKHMAGFWRCIPLGSKETLIVFYHEAVPIVPLPAVFRTLTGKFLSNMAASMLEDVRERAVQWELAVKA